MMLKLLWWFMSHMKGGDEIMAMFFAQRVILGKTKFADVPTTLQPAVKELLVESGLGYLADTTQA